MLEDLIIRTFRRIRNRRARQYDVAAHNEDELTAFYEKAQRAVDLLDAPDSVREDVRVALNKHRDAAREARRRAENIRNGRRG